MSRRVRALALFFLLLLLAGCDQQPTGPAVPIPDPDLTDMEPQVAQRLREMREKVEKEPRSADAWGRFGMVAHAHELWDEAIAAYRQAEELSPDDERWPYYLGDVLSVEGTDEQNEASIQAFRRAMALRADYAPAHMRLGRVLVAAGQSETAAIELERALELAPGLQPARVTLAQIRLAEGKLEVAERLLDEILEKEPRHAQALSTLGQVYMRQGRRDEAREIAGRTRSAATYNLYDDPLMSKVVAEGVSSLQLWDRAKAFLDNGNYKQAALGLQQVVRLKPDNPDVHQQLATAYGHLGDLKRSRRHLEKTVALVPDRIDARIQLAILCLDQQSPAEAIPHLRRILELDPDDPDAGWLLGRARLQSGDPRGALDSFEKAEARTEAAEGTTGATVPSWARNEWGNALAQVGRTDAALEQFRAVLADDPHNAQAQFYIGLVYEGLGRIEEAKTWYCRSMKSQSNPPASTRLNILGHTCS